MEQMSIFCSILAVLLLISNQLTPKMKRLFLLVLTLVSTLTIEAQQTALQKANALLQSKKELTFTFQVSNHKVLNEFSKSLSIVNYNDATHTVTAWANADQFNAFLSKNIPFEVPNPENDLTARLMSNQLPTVNNDPSYTLTFPLTAYPTYADYAQQMTDFANLYPNLCELVDLGPTTEGDKHLLFLKISDNIGTDEQEPRLLYTSTMHGDEVTGYVLMLDLIDYLLTAYNDTGHTDHLRIKDLIDNSEIWINPNANPDGTYYNDPSNTSLTYARRANANNIDLNRNYPDNVGGSHPDGNAYQIETQAFMNLAASTHFVVSANFHGGTEVFNYPWDNTSTRHPDDDWFFFVGKEYAINCQNNSPSGYMDAVYAGNQWPGVTNGSDWYQVQGGRQDYMNFYYQCKENTIELSDVKKPSAAVLDDHWNYNKEALIDYLLQGTYGFRGVVKDANTNAPIAATIKITGHDALGSWAVTDLPYGDYYRPIKAGTYDLTFEAPCYESFTLPSQTIADYETLVLPDVLLTPLNTVPTGIVASGINMDSATVNWNAASDSYDLRYRVVGSSTWTTITGLTSTTYNITGLTAETDYEVQVQAYCNSNSSGYSLSSTFTTLAVNYCTAQGNSVTDEYISNVSLNGADNTTSTPASGYSDFTGASIFDYLVVGATGNQISVTKHWTGTQYNEAVAVWIDFNHDGTFDASEMIMDSPSSTTTPVSTTFPVPSTAMYGSTRMRVIMQYYNGTGSSVASSCGNFSYGEVEDYTVYLSYDGLMYADNMWTPNAPSAATGADNVLILEGNYTVNSDVAVNNLNIDANASVTVSKTGSVTVNGDLTTNNNLTLQSDSNEYSSLIVSGSVTGDATYQRHVNTNPNGNDLIAAPVSGQLFTDFIADNSNIVSNGTNTSFLFGPFDKATGTYVLYSNTESSALTTGTGYRAASTDGGTFSFTGTVNTGTVNVNISDSGPSYAEWNLIGNPYPSYIKLADFLSTNSVYFDNQKMGVYGYDGSASDGWTIYNQAFSDANPNAVITPGQGFYVASKVGGGTISFTPNMRAMGTGDDFIIGRTSSANAISHLKLKLKTAAQQYFTEFYFTDQASLGLDPGYDAAILGSSAPNFSVYSRLVNENQGVDMAVQSVANSDLSNNLIIPLGVNANQGEQLTISIESTSLDPNIDVYLEDTVANTTVLLNDSDYTLTPTSNLSEIGRFNLRFESQALSAQDEELNKIQIYSTSAPKRLHIDGLFTETTQLKLYDVQGRLVLDQPLKTNVSKQQLDASKLVTGLYFVTVKNENRTKTKKLLIK